MEENEFIDTVIAQLSYLKEDVIIHRIGADSKSDDLIAPLWVRKKMSIVDKIDTLMEESNVFQGEKF